MASPADDNNGITSSADSTSAEPLAEIKLVVPQHLQRAFQRSLMVLAHEEGRDRLDFMREMVEDFLRRHGC